MDTFRLISVVLSMVLGLGVTRLLLGLVGIFRARRVSRLDWLVPTWAFSLFLVQLEYWWAINQLPLVMDSFNFHDFMALVVLTLALFVAAALLVPSRSEDEAGSLRQFFELDGKWALPALSAFFVMGFLANVFFLRVSPISWWGLFDIPLVAIPLVFATKSRRLQEVLSAAFVPLLVADVAISLVG
jgi:hypothetical protein